MAVAFYSVQGDGSTRFIGRVHRGRVLSDPDGFIEENVRDDYLRPDDVDPFDPEYLTRRWTGVSVFAVEEGRTWFEGYSVDQLRELYDRYGEHPNGVNLRARGKIKQELERRGQSSVLNSSE